MPPGIFDSLATFALQEGGRPGARTADVSCRAGRHQGLRTPPNITDARRKAGTSDGDGAGHAGRARRTRTTSTSTPLTSAEAFCRTTSSSSASPSCVRIIS